MPRDYGFIGRYGDRCQSQRGRRRFSYEFSPEVINHLQTMEVTMFPFIQHMLDRLHPPVKTLEDIAQEAKEMREHLSEKQIDKTLQDSFPANDPNAWY